MIAHISSCLRREGLSETLAELNLACIVRTHIDLQVWEFSIYRCVWSALKSGRVVVPQHDGRIGIY